MSAVEARFVDGKSAAPRRVVVAIQKDGLAIDARGVPLFWRWRHVFLAAPIGNEVRLSSTKELDALLIFSAGAKPLLAEMAPHLFSGARSRRRIAGFVVLMIIITSAIAAALFGLSRLRAAPSHAQINVITKPYGDVARQKNAPAFARAFP